MQTFLPYTSYKLSAMCLDNKRLGKQRVEAHQILRAILFDTGWKNHPAVKMWKKYPYHLCLYGIEMCKEWRARGFQDTMLERFEAQTIPLEKELKKSLTCFSDVVLQVKLFMCLKAPNWLDTVQESHRSNLLRKDFNFYKQYNWNVPIDLPYHWPI